MQSLQPPQSQPILACTALCKQFGSVRAVDEVSLHVLPGEFIVVLGPSGAGKSTLLRCCNRLLRPTSGRLEFEGLDITNVSGHRLRRVRQNVGMIFQQFGLVKRLTVLQNVLIGRSRFHDSILGILRTTLRFHSQTDRDHAMECLRRVGIESIAHQRADTLSGGQQQRVAIARLLAQQPRLILADEPIASLDPASAERVMQALADIHRGTIRTADSNPQPPAILVNLHQVEIARRFATRIIGMSRGRVIFDGPAAQLTPSIIAELYAQAPSRDGEAPHLQPDVPAQIVPFMGSTHPAGATS